MLAILFLVFYFYFDSEKVGLLKKVIGAGFLIGVSAYVLYGFKFNKWLKGITLLIIVVLTYFLSQFFIKNQMAGKVSVTDRRLFGNWVTDTTGGYTVNMYIEADSAYLSQSNFPLSRAYKAVTINDTIILTSEDVAKIYKWNYRFLDNEYELQLYSLEDTLLLKKR